MVLHLFQNGLLETPEPGDDNDIGQGGTAEMVDQVVAHQARGGKLV